MATSSALATGKEALPYYTTKEVFDGPLMPAMMLVGPTLCKTTAAAGGSSTAPIGLLHLLREAVKEQVFGDDAVVVELYEHQHVPNICVLFAGLTDIVDVKTREKWQRWCRSRLQQPKSQVQGHRIARAEDVLQDVAAG